MTLTTLQTANLKTRSSRQGSLPLRRRGGLFLQCCSFFARVSLSCNSEHTESCSLGSQRGGEEEGEGEGPAEDLGDRQYMDISLEHLFIPLSFFHRLAVKLTSECAD